MTITADTMRAKLLDLDQVRAALSRTEPLNPEPFTVGDAVRFHASTGWNHGVTALDGNDPVGVYVTLGRGTRAREYQLTRSTLEETCTAFGFPRAYVKECPAELLTPHMNYWFRTGLLAHPRKNKDFQYLVNGDTCVAFVRQNLLPFSNLALLDQAQAAITSAYGDVEILADYKFSHTLRATHLRLIVPDVGKVLTATGSPDDRWSIGVQVKNSLTGSTQTSIEGYLFRWVCTNGQIDTRAASGTWTRRKEASETEVYAWARQAVDEALSGLPGCLDAVQRLTDIGIDGSLSDTLRDVFAHYHIPIHQRSKIIKVLEEYDGEITMYVIMNAITQVANEPGLEPATVESLLRVGGDLPHTAEQRCGACHRMMHQH